MINRHKNVSVYDDKSDDISQNSVKEFPPWCSSRKVCERRKPRKVTSPTWEIRSSYPVRENIWEYLHRDKTEQDFKCNTKRNTRKLCRKQVLTKKQNGKKKYIIIFLIFLFISLGMLKFWQAGKSEIDFVIHFITNTRESLSGLGSFSFVNEECCERMKFLSATILRTNIMFRNVQRLRRTTLLTSESTKTMAVLSAARLRAAVYVRPLPFVLNAASDIDKGYVADVMVTKGSDTKEWGGRVALWGVVPLWRAAPPPSIILALRTPMPSDCWAFSGSEGEILFELPRKLKISHMSIEHISPDSARSAPRKFTLYGVLENGTWIKAIDAEYRYKGPAKQYFLLSSRTILLDRLVLRIFSNQGNQRYTCVYRIHLHKNLTKLD